MRNKPGYAKNMDDVLCTGSNVEQLEKRLRNLLDICRERNMKLKRKKFEVGTSVTYGGCDLASIWTKRGRQILITPSTAKLDALINLDKPTTRRECQVVIGMVNQL